MKTSTNAQSQRGHFTSTGGIWLAVCVLVIYERQCWLSVFCDFDKTFINRSAALVDIRLSAGKSDTRVIPNARFLIGADVCGAVGQEKSLFAL